MLLLGQLYIPRNDGQVLIPLNYYLFQSVRKRPENNRQFLLWEKLPLQQLPHGKPRNQWCCTQLPRCWRVMFRQYKAVERSPSHVKTMWLSIPRETSTLKTCRVRAALRAQL